MDLNFFLRGKVLSTVFYSLTKAKSVTSWVTPVEFSFSTDPRIWVSLSNSREVLAMTIFVRKKRFVMNQLLVGLPRPDRTSLISVDEKNRRNSC